VIISPRFINFLFILLLLALMSSTVLFLLWKKLYSRLSARITVLILASGLITIIILLVSDGITRDTFPSPWVRLLQAVLLILGGPAALGLFAAHFVRRPLRQFNNAVASLEQSNYKVQLEPTGIHEFDEVFTKFNNLTHRLQHEEKLRKDLVSDTSHELNTPLTVMIGQLTAMQEGKHALTKERISMLREQAERLADLVQQLDTYTKARTPDTDNAETINLKEFCKELIGHFSLDLKQKKIRTTLHIADDYVLRANRNALRQILTNLIQNSLRYSEATEIVITADARQLKFSDNGKGVPSESLAYLFERFYRVDKSRNRATGGLGLGLAIVQELVESQGWTVVAKAGQPGLVFVITLAK